MPRYRYERLRVFRFHPVEFTPSDLRKAVDVLRETPDPNPETSCIGLEAIVTVSAGPFKLLARPILKIDQILGKTPSEVWAVFDAMVDKDRKALIRRDLGYDPGDALIP